jgi:holin-like protein
MLRALLLFAAADAIGEAAHRLLHLPIPGAVLGMVLLFAFFAWRGAAPPATERTGRAVLRLLPFFFVPAGVGAVEHATLVAPFWPAIVAAVIGSSLCALLVTGFVLRALERDKGGAPALLAARGPGR